MAGKGAKGENPKSVDQVIYYSFFVDGKFIGELMDSAASRKEVRRVQGLSGIRIERTVKGGVKQ